VQKTPINDHDYDSPSLEFAYGGNMRKNMPHICSIYALHILPNSAYFSAYFAFKISRKFSTILNPYLIGTEWPILCWCVIKILLTH